MAKLVDKTGLTEYVAKVKEKLALIGDSSTGIPAVDPRKITPKVEDVTLNWSCQASPDSSTRHSGTFTATRINLSDHIRILCANTTLPTNAELNGGKSNIQISLDWSGQFTIILGGSINYGLGGRPNSRADHVNIYDTGADTYVWDKDSVSGVNTVMGLIVIGYY